MEDADNRGGLIVVCKMRILSGKFLKGMRTGKIGCMEGVGVGK